MLFMTTAFGKNVPKYGAWYKSRRLKNALKFQQKCWRNRTEWFVAFTLCCRHCSLRKFDVEIDSRGQCYKTFIYSHFTAKPSFCIIKPNYLGNYRRMEANTVE
jgi:hypothetical protein